MQRTLLRYTSPSLPLLFSGKHQSGLQTALSGTPPLKMKPLHFLGTPVVISNVHHLWTFFSNLAVKNEINCCIFIIVLFIIVSFKLFFFVLLKIKLYIFGI